MAASKKEVRYTEITCIDKNAGNKMRLNDAAFQRFFHLADIGDQPFCIVSVSGKARQGKSFLMNLMLRYLHKSVEGKEWIGSVDENCDMSTFVSEKGIKSVTSGIRLCHDVIEVPWKNGETMKVILADTQGLFHGQHCKQHDLFLLTLTTVMSSVQIFNTMNQIDTNDLTYLEDAIDYAMTSNADGNDGSHYMKLQDLVLVVRDNDEDRKKYFEDMMQDGFWHEDNLPLRNKLVSSFENLSLYTLECPKKKVRSGQFKSTISFGDIGADFLEMVDELFKNTIDPCNLLQPKCRKNGQPCRARELMKVMACCDKLFAKFENRKQSDLLLEANERILYHEMYEDALKSFYNQTKDVEAEDLDEFGRIYKEAAKEALRHYQKSSSERSPRPGRDFRTKYEDRLQVETSEAIKTKMEFAVSELARVRRENANVAYGEYHLIIAKEAAALADLEPEELEKRHNEILGAITSRMKGAFDMELLEKLAKNELERVICQARKMKKQMREAKDERENLLLSKLQLQVYKLDTDWRQRLKQETSRDKIGSAENQVEDLRWLRLTIVEIRQIASAVEISAKKEYWEASLLPVERNASARLNKMAWEALERRFPGIVKTQADDIFNPNPVGTNEVGEDDAKYMTKVKELLLEMEKNLEKVVKKDAHRLVLETHKKFFEFCFTPLMTHFNSLDEDLRKKAEEILKEQDRLVESGKELFFTRVNQSILAVEQILGSEMATKHLAQNAIESPYESVKKNLLSSIPAIIGFNPGRNLDKVLKEETEKVFSASMNRMSHENTRNKEDAVFTDVDVDQSNDEPWYRGLLRNVVTLAGPALVRSAVSSCVVS